MIVKPNELANLCSIFSSLRIKKISVEDLNRFTRSSMLIDSYANVDGIIGEAMNSGLVNLESGNYCISKIGQQLGKRQGEPGYQITDKARDCFINSVLLNVNSNQWCCGEFLLKFHVDTVLETFVYDRHINESDSDTKWLMILSDVGLIRVDQDKATIENRYLDNVNNLFIGIRNPDNMDVFDTYNERNKVGDLAEDLAFKYEKDRLTSKGFPTLAVLVQQISKIDKSAGYDILSFRGVGKDPDSKILIEVKGTRESNLRFIWSYNERRVAASETHHYWIYVYTNVDLNSKSADGPIVIKNPNSNLTKLGYISVPLDVYVTKEA